VDVGPLFAAAQEGQTEVALFLLEHGKRTALRSRCTQTPHVICTDG
jgi:hypothetical protein